MHLDEKITVIIPVYNVEQFLARCIDSIRNQSYKNLEILLIDDGSTDKSAKICDEYAEIDERIRVIHQENKGIASVRNLGVSQATGNYIFWIDSDDYVSGEIIFVLYSNLKRYHADMSICEFKKGNEIDYVFSQNNTDTCIEFTAQYAHEMLYKNNHTAFVIAASWAKLIKKELYEGLVYPEGKLFEDIYMSHYLIQRCSKIIYIDKVLYYYYQWPDSILGKTLRIEKLDYLDAFKDRISFYQNLNNAKLLEMARIQYLHSLIWEYSRVKNILHNKELMKKIKREYRQCYKLGIENKAVPNETQGYMLFFYLSPALREFMDKVQGKILRWIKNETAVG